MTPRSDIAQLIGDTCESQSLLVSHKRINVLQGHLDAYISITVLYEVFSGRLYSVQPFPFHDKVHLDKALQVALANLIWTREPHGLPEDNIVDLFEDLFRWACGYPRESHIFGGAFLAGPERCSHYSVRKTLQFFFHLEIYRNPGH